MNIYSDLTAPCPMGHTLWRHAKKKSCSPEVVWYNSFGKSASGLTLWSLRDAMAGQGECSEGRRPKKAKRSAVSSARSQRIPQVPQGVLIARGNSYRQPSKTEERFSRGHQGKPEAAPVTRARATNPPARATRPGTPRPPRPSRCPIRCQRGTSLRRVRCSSRRALDATHMRDQRKPLVAPARGPLRFPISRRRVSCSRSYSIREGRAAASSST